MFNLQRATEIVGCIALWAAALLLLMLVPFIGYAIFQALFHGVLK